jgi:rifampicin phosphotransferase
LENLEFVPPGPGSWELETVHFNRPVSYYGGAMFFDALMEGMRQSNDHYGAPLEYLDFQIVNRLIYLQPRPFGAPPGATGLPPKWLFSLIQNLHPAIRRRRKRARFAVQEKLWRDDVKLWDTEVKPGVLARAAELRAIQPTSLSDEDLIVHLKECHQFARQTVVNHHRFNNTFGVPLGIFLSQSIAWTGLAPGELLRLFEGYSEVSRGSMTELNALRDALASDAEMTALVHSDTAPDTVLETLKGRDGPVSDAVNAYINGAGYCMLTGYDVADLMAIESPEMMVKLIRAALDGNTDGGDLAGDKATAAIRDAVPEEHRAEFDELLIEARLTYRMRDERGGNGDAMSVALSRRAVLEAGRRLAEQGKVLDATDTPDATLDEIIVLLGGGTSPSPDEIHARAEYRLSHTVDGAPPFLGPEPTPPPPVDWFPKSARRLQSAFMVMFRLMFESGGKASEDKVVHGLGVFPGSYEGPVRIIDGIEDIEKIEDGDIIVARTTAPSINVVLPLIGALVTDRGGLLSHAAIVAREYGLPAVVGCDDATERLSEGMRVRVDGEKGEVCILD